MNKKPLFTEKELKAAFDGSDYQKYAIIKKDLAKTIIRYLLANPEIKKNNEATYEKALILQSKYMLCDPLKTDPEQIKDLVEKTALSDIEASKDSYTNQGSMQLIMDMFLSLE